MRWSIIRLIWFRELRDQLRDRRTIFMIAVLPVLLYPVAGFGAMQLFRGFFNQKHLVGVAGVENLLPWSPEPSVFSPAQAVGWFAFTPPSPGAPLAGVAHLGAAVSLVLAQPPLTNPPLIEMRDGRLAFSPRYLDAGPAETSLLLQQLDAPLPASPSATAADILKSVNRSRLDERKIDLLIVVPPGFQQDLAKREKAVLYILTRESDETSRLVNVRVTTVINRWKRDLKEVRLAQMGLPIDFDEPVRIYDPERARAAGGQSDQTMFGLFVRVFPFILVMWSLAGALYPAIDVCAGEKERGTMETLLISPASREEIVWGKFLTIWVFSSATALLNLLSMAATTWPLGAVLPGASIQPMALFWAVVLLLPLSAFFSALCLSVGAYARSSKEGQYYLMPLFLGTMPLIFLTLAPGVELNPFYSMVPVTGVALLLQRLMGSTSPGRGVLFYFLPVLAPMVIYSWLALRWAISQFQREEVLFREAERLDIGLWLRRLLRDKETLPSAGEAIFCFVLILGLRWMSLGVGQHLSMLARTGIAQLAFVAAPPLFMAVMLTTRPRLGLALRLPAWWAWPAAALLTLFVVPPLAGLTLVILRQFPALRALLELNHPLTRELLALSGPTTAAAQGQYFLVLALLPGLCEELAFRGFILTGLLRGFKPWTAIFLSAFLFSLYQMNVFQFLPHFILGVVLGMLVVRSGSVLPAMLFHPIYNSLLIAPSVAPDAFAIFKKLTFTPDVGSETMLSGLLVWVVYPLLAGAVLYAVWRLGERRSTETPHGSE